MSSARLLRIACDGPRFGVACTAAPVSDALSLYDFRAQLRRNGWTRRHHHDTQVDLCASCSSRVRPVVVGVGRPRKAPAA